MSPAYWHRRVARQGGRLRTVVELNGGDWFVSVVGGRSRDGGELAGIGVQPSFDAACRRALDQLQEVTLQDRLDRIRDSLARGGE